MIEATTADGLLVRFDPTSVIAVSKEANLISGLFFNIDFFMGTRLRLEGSEGEAVYNETKEVFFKASPSTDHTEEQSGKMRVSIQDRLRFLATSAMVKASSEELIQAADEIERLRATIDLASSELRRQTGWALAVLEGEIPPPTDHTKDRK